MQKGRKVKPSIEKQMFLTMVVSCIVYFLFVLLTGNAGVAAVMMLMSMVLFVFVLTCIDYKRENIYELMKEAETVLMLRNKNIIEYELEDKKVELEFIYEDNYVVIQKNGRGEQKVFISPASGPILCIDYDKVIIEEDSSIIIPSLFKFKVKQEESSIWSQMWVIIVPERTVLNM